MTFKYALLELPAMATERRYSYSYANIKKNSIGQVVVAEGKTCLLIEESEDLACRAWTTERFAVGENI